MQIVEREKATIHAFAVACDAALVETALSGRLQHPLFHLATDIALGIVATRRAGLSWFIVTTAAAIAIDWRMDGWRDWR